MLVALDVVKDVPEFTNVGQLVCAPYFGAVETTNWPIVERILLKGRSENVVRYSVAP